MATLTKPRLKKGETPQSPSFQKRMAAFQRQEALAEATAAQAAQNKAEAEAAAKRDVVAEAADKPKQKATTSAKPPATKKVAPTKPVTGVASTARNALRERAKTIQEAVEGGIQEADEDAKRKK